MYLGDMTKEELLFAPETPLGEFELAVRKAWCRETAYPGNQAEWSEGNPAFGQCAVTLLVLMDYFPGGRILRSSEYHHYAYEINGETIDLTGEQFGPGVKIEFDGERTRADLLEAEAAIKAGTLERYMLLAQNVREVLGCPDQFWLHLSL